MAGEAVRGDEEFGLTPNSAQDDAAAAAVETPAPAPAPKPTRVPKGPAAQQDRATDLRQQDEGAFDKDFGLERNVDRGKGKPAPQTRTTTVKGGEPVEGEESDEEEGGEGGEGDEGGKPSGGADEGATPKEGEGGEGGEAPPLAEAVQDLTLEERQELLDVLLASEGAEDLELTYQANDQDQRERWFDVRKKAAGYAGEERASAQLAEQRAALKQEADQLKARANELGAHLQDPKKLFGFLGEYGDDPLAFYKGFVEVAQKYIEDAERDPTAYRFEQAMRRRDRKFEERFERMVQELQGRKGPEVNDEGERPRKLSDAEVQQIIAERTRVVRRAGYDPDVVGTEYVKAGRPDDFTGWFKRYVEQDKRSKALREGDVQRARGGPAVRRTGGAPAGGGGGKKPVAAGAWPSATEIAKDVEGIQGKIGRRR